MGQREKKGVINAIENLDVKMYRRPRKLAIARELISTIHRRRRGGKTPERGAKKKLCL